VGSLITTGREDFACGSAVLLMLSKDFNIELSDYKAEDATLRQDGGWHVVKNVVGGVPTVLEVGIMCFLMALSRIVLQGYMLTNLFDPMRYKMHLETVEVSIKQL
jgi:hypothetical protein